MGLRLGVPRLFFFGLSALVLLLATACGRSADTEATIPLPVSTAPTAVHPSDAASDATGASAKELSSPSSSARSTSKDGASVGPGTCHFGRALVGEISGAKALMRVTQKGNDLSGSYFYERTGGDLKLRGKAEHGSFTLEETSAGKPTGKFVGVCDEAGGISGNWSIPDDRRQLAFDFEVPKKLRVVAQRTTLTTKKKATPRGSIDADSFGDTCHYERRVPVVVGAETQQIEETLAKTIAQNYPKELSDPKDEQAARKCSQDGDEGRLAEFDAGFEVARLDPDLLVLELSGSWNVVPSAHPANAVGATVLNLALATGKRVVPEDTILDRSRLVELAQSCVDRNGPQLSTASPAFLFLTRGIKVVGTSYGHSEAVFTFQGPEVSYGALLRDGLLGKLSPISRLWATERPILVGADPCAARWTLRPN